MEIMISASRFTKAVSLVLGGGIEQPSSTAPVFLVPAGDPSVGPYVVVATSDVSSCSCPWGLHAPTDWSNPCAHALAAAAFGEVPIPAVVPID